MLGLLPKVCSWWLCGYDNLEPEERIGLSTSILPRWRSTTELFRLYERYYHATGYFLSCSRSGVTAASLISSGPIVVRARICFSMPYAAFESFSKFSSV